MSPRTPAGRAPMAAMRSAAQAAAGRPCRRRVQVGDGSSGTGSCSTAAGPSDKALVLAPGRSRRSRTSRCRALYARRRLPWCRVRPRLMCPTLLSSPRGRAVRRQPRARARRFRATSASDGRMTRREISRTWATWPQVQTGGQRDLEAVARLASQEALHDPVLEGVVADDHQPAARPEHTEGRGEACLERPRARG